MFIDFQYRSAAVRKLVWKYTD